MIGIILVPGDPSPERYIPFKLKGVRSEVFLLRLLQYSDETKQFFDVSKR